MNVIIDGYSNRQYVKNETSGFFKNGVNILLPLIEEYLMKSWLTFFIALFVIVLIPIMIQFQLTRSAMAKFAKRHSMTYKKIWWNLFNIGEIQGEVDYEVFSMGSMSSKYGFGPEVDQQYEEMKYPQMCIQIKGMPRKLVISKRTPSRIGAIAEVSSGKARIPVLETGDEAFDSQFKVIGYQDEVLPWLTARRREVIAAFLSRDHYHVSSGCLKYGTSKTRIRFDEMEEAFSHLTATQSELQKAQ